MKQEAEEWAPKTEDVDQNSLRAKKKRSSSRLHSNERSQHQSSRPKRRRRSSSRDTLPKYTFQWDPTECLGEEVISPPDRTDDDKRDRQQQDRDARIFKEYRNLAWFQERYHPIEKLFWKTHHAEYRRLLSQDFETGLFSTLKEPDSDLRKINLRAEADGNCPDSAFCFKDRPNTLFLKFMPDSIKRMDLLSELRAKVPGFVRLFMSRPILSTQMQRLAWIELDTAENYEQAIEMVQTISFEGRALQAIPSYGHSKAAQLKTASPVPEAMIELDLALAKELITRILDREAGIATWVVAAIDSAENISNEIKLNLLLLYMRKVHAYCLYCGEQYEDERMLASACGVQHLRNSKTMSEEAFKPFMELAQEQADDMVNDRQFGVDDFNDGDTAADITRQFREGEDFYETGSPQQDPVPAALVKQEDGVPFEKAEGLFPKALLLHRQLAQLDSSSCKAWSDSLEFIKKYIGSALHLIERGEEKPQSMEQLRKLFMIKDLGKFFHFKTRVIEKNKAYQCDLCSKRFQGADFVEKHIRSRHVDMIIQSYQEGKAQEWLNKDFGNFIRAKMEQAFVADSHRFHLLPYTVYQKRSNPEFRRGPRTRSPYRDVDNPDRNWGRRRELAQEAERELVDYSDLFQ